VKACNPFANLYFVITVSAQPKSGEPLIRIGLEMVLVLTNGFLVYHYETDCPYTKDQGDASAFKNIAQNGDRTFIIASLR
jgi:hypothetical protein